MLHLQKVYIHILWNWRCTVSIVRSRISIQSTQKEKEMTRTALKSMYERVSIGVFRKLPEYFLAYAIQLLLNFPPPISWGNCQIYTLFLLPYAWVLLKNNSKNPKLSDGFHKWNPSLMRFHNSVKFYTKILLSRVWKWKYMKHVTYQQKLKSASLQVVG